MYLQIDVTGDRTCGKTTVLGLIQKALEDQDGISISQTDPIVENGETEMLTMEVFMDEYPSPKPTLKDYTELLIEAAATSKDHEGTAQMKLSQAAVNCIIALAQFTQVDIITKQTEDPACR